MRRVMVIERRAPVTVGEKLVAAYVGRHGNAEWNDDDTWLAAKIDDALRRRAPLLDGHGGRGKKGGR